MDSTKPTSKVIDSLHSQIDSLKDELTATKVSHDEYKKKFTIVSQKNDSLVDQLANVKHENDMIAALLKRKERRINDLEDDYNKLVSDNDSMKLTNKSLKIRCESLQASTATSTAEYERLKIAYEALIASQNGYKAHYTKQIKSLTEQLYTYKVDSKRNFDDLALKFDSNSKDIDILVDSLSGKRKALDHLVVSRNKSILDLLAKLAHLAKVHGTHSKTVLEDSVMTLTHILEKYPDLKDKLASVDPESLLPVVDVETLLAESTSSIAQLEITSNNTNNNNNNNGDGGDRRQSRVSSTSSNPPSTRRRGGGRQSRNTSSVSSKRNSLILDNNPRGQGQNEISVIKRGSNQFGGNQHHQQRRKVSPLNDENKPIHRQSQFNNYNHMNNNMSNSMNNTNVNNNNMNYPPNPNNRSSNKSKRRSMYGGSNNYNQNHQGSYNKRLSQNFDSLQLNI
ncbi:mother-specific HO expression [Scheffersomyces spartinae]|uniref:SWI5-dependent HO expression protein 3 n=1 Tax=Scheffersomyces spartinae TaxID=45513 RepID=A0A9P8AIY2_9ASCO|nr:mother-specific HO expression [Scheffersomyces spartinae]KAG7193606.1 mother-specific HO expression [Scheffersomyces spartinae]